MSKSRKENDAKYYQTHKEEIRERWGEHHKEYILKATRDFKVKCILFKGSHCVRCTLGYDGTNGAMFHLHHVGSKTDNINRFLYKPWEDAVEELNKCILLCANCHSKMHAGDY